MAAETGNLYTVRQTAAISTVRTIIQVVAGTGKPLTILRMWMTQSSSAVGAQEAIEVVRKSAAGTTTAVTPVSLRPSQPAATFTAGHNATAEGTITDTLDSEGTGVLGGWLWTATPDEQIEVPPAGVLAIRFTVAPVSQAWRYGMTVVEVG
jgi:hypothetical protein